MLSTQLQLEPTDQCVLPPLPLPPALWPLCDVTTPLLALQLEGVHSILS